MEGTSKALISRRGLLKATLRVMAGYVVAGLGLGVYGNQIESGWLKLERIRITIPALPPAFDGYRIVQLSDIHLGPATKRETISRATQMTLDLAPDLIVLTGDYITERLDAAALQAELRRLAAPDGVWAIMGNHDHWVNPEGVRQVLTDAKITELRNSSIAVRRADQALWLVGVDDIWEKHHDLPLALSEVSPGATAILLAHEPDYADQVAPVGRIALQLSGHSHGGQLRLPGGMAPFAPYLGRKYPHGLRKVGGMWLYTNRGVGQNNAIRVNCRPEVTEITLARG